MVNRQMNRIVGACLAAVIISCACAKPTHDVPHYVECVDSSDCAKDECCTIGLGRFTIPVCSKRLDLDEHCGSVREPFNTSVFYPDGSAVDLTNVYVHFCPCQSHLSCPSSTQKCTDPMDKSYFNYIDDTGDDNYLNRDDY
ncbi:Prokineticin [Nesidiocoris tenuis]|uniref:Prokineticin n=1 Tax=Nesidiocoris tenuis TaxID=355587 RepID=A0ABN7B4Y9_9HEMI|nr:Prokineticin [Nesidiocoris tenuis]